MSLDLYMLGLIVQDMGASLEFYRRLGLAIPEGSEQQTHVEVKMGNGLTFFLDSRPGRWDPNFAGLPANERPAAVSGYSSLLEFYLDTREAVEAKYHELVGYGYRSHAEPYATPFGMCFAFVLDPDGNTILLSGALEP
jgi:catechol 2,3-dioxygenase-like lactoylglutathione lyase family enzyme